MWIEFNSKRPFAIKLYVGGINAVSGEPEGEDLATKLRQKVRLEEGKCVQNYIVTGPSAQKWIDGVATATGKVMQFVAAPAGTGYSVEAQLTGKDSVAGLPI